MRNFAPTPYPFRPKPPIVMSAVFQFILRSSLRLLHVSTSTKAYDSVFFVFEVQINMWHKEAICDFKQIKH